MEHIESEMVMDESDQRGQQWPILVPSRSRIDVAGSFAEMKRSRRKKSYVCMVDCDSYTALDFFDAFPPSSSRLVTTTGM